MDLETIVNCFVSVFIDLKNSKNFKVFVINRDKNQLSELLDFLESNIENKDWHLGFNNLSFDSQIIEYILDNKTRLSFATADEISSELYYYAQSVINKSNNGQFLDYPEFKLKIQCIDIYKLNHWDSNAKKASLKWVQFSMKWYSVEEMPHKHYRPVLDNLTLKNVINYCFNDVLSTKAIFNHKNQKGEKTMLSQIKLRDNLSNLYNLKLHSASEPKISKQIFLHFLSERLNLDKRTISQYRTKRPFVKVDNLILPFVKFDLPEFKNVYDFFKNLIVNTSILDENEESQKKKGPSFTMKHKNVETVFALGGIHGCISSGVYIAEKGKKIMTADVTSYYPNLAIRNKWSPAQINKEVFCELYEWFFEERKKYDKSNPLNYLFKIVLNSTYGMSKSKYSFLYDPELTFRITANGQLLLAMLYEMITTRIPNSVPLMQNTDGLEFIIDEKDEKLYYQICKEWELLTNLQLEIDEYQKMIIGDVNNYIAVFKNGKVKCKGRFEYEDLPLHKNPSAQIIPKAWYQYFINNVKPEDYIASNKDILDYCIGSKIKGDWFFVEKGVDFSRNYYEKPLQKIVRYFVSNSGIKIFKHHPDGRKIQLESGSSMITIFNKIETKNFEDYNVNYKYYLQKIYDEIKKIESFSKDEKTSSQLSLEF